MILGAPGSGKTTFLKYLSLAYLGFVPVPGALLPLLPIYIPLREFGRIEEPKPSATWLTAFAMSCASDMSRARFTDEWLTNRLNNGDCIILLDGLDEVPPQQVKTIMQSISAFRTKYGTNKIIATCRGAVFEYGLERFKICEIDTFNDNDIRAFAT